MGDHVTRMVVHLQQVRGLQVEQQRHRRLRQLRIGQRLEQHPHEPLPFLLAVAIELDRQSVPPLGRLRVPVVDAAQHLVQPADEALPHDRALFPPVRDNDEGARRPLFRQDVPSQVLAGLNEHPEQPRAVLDRLGLCGQEDRHVLPHGQPRVERAEDAWLSARVRFQARLEARALAGQRRAVLQPVVGVGPTQGGRQLGQGACPERPAEKALAVRGEADETRDIVTLHHLGPAVVQVLAPFAAVADVPVHLVERLRDEGRQPGEHVLEMRPDNPQVEVLRFGCAAQPRRAGCEVDASVDARRAQDMVELDRVEQHLDAVGQPHRAPPLDVDHAEAASPRTVVRDPHEVGPVVGDLDLLRVDVQCVVQGGGRAQRQLVEELSVPGAAQQIDALLDRPDAIRQRAVAVCDERAAGEVVGQYLFFPRAAAVEDLGHHRAGLVAPLGHAVARWLARRAEAQEPVAVVEEVPRQGGWADAERCARRRLNRPSQAAHVRRPSPAWSGSSTRSPGSRGFSAFDDGGTAPSAGASAGCSAASDQAYA